MPKQRRAQGQTRVATTTTTGGKYNMMIRGIWLRSLQLMYGGESDERRWTIRLRLIAVKPDRNLPWLNVLTKQLGEC